MCYNGYLLFMINGLVVVGYSSGEVMSVIEWIVVKLLVGIGYVWLG